MTWKEVEVLKKDELIAILPLGSTEQHGERLPLGTDHLCCEYVAKKVAKKIPNSILLPCQKYGMSWHHTAFPGTISIDPPTYELLLKDIFKSIVRSGIKKILVVNGHGGNHQYIENATKFIKEYDPDVEIINPLVSIFTGPEMKKIVLPLKEPNAHTSHASAAEVSMLLAIHPNLVRVPSVVTDKTVGVFGQGTDSPSSWKRQFPMGSKGDQTKANLRVGKKIFEFIIAQFIKHAQVLI